MDVKSLEARPLDDLVRVAPLDHATPKTRAAVEGEKQRVLFGHFAVFNEWTEIDNWEGHFFERIAPGAFKKTFAENRDRMLPIYEHGFDAFIGSKPLGPIDVLREDDIGAYYEVPLIDTDYNREFIIPAADAGILGASFRFRSLKHRLDMPAEGSTDLPRVTHLEVQVREFGPCPIGYYKEATAGLRSRAEVELWRSLDESGRAELASLMRKTIGTPDPGAATQPPDGAGDDHSSASRSTRETRMERVLTMKGLK